ncbi:MAG: hypothetical protein ABFD54_08890 [Armatimonadota bacterium]|nr:hypothetical protein [bacterium]
MPEWLMKEGPTAAVAIAAMWLFLGSLDKWGKSRDKERDMFLSALNESQKAYMQAVLALVGLAQRMVDGCQHNVDESSRVTDGQVMAAAGCQKKGESNEL